MTTFLCTLAFLWLLAGGYSVKKCSNVTAALAIVMHGLVALGLATLAVWTWSQR